MVIWKIFRSTKRNNCNLNSSFFSATNNSKTNLFHNTESLNLGSRKMKNKTENKSNIPLTLKQISIDCLIDIMMNK